MTPTRVTAVNQTPCSPPQLGGRPAKPEEAQGYVGANSETAPHLIAVHAFPNATSS